MLVGNWIATGKFLTSNNIGKCQNIWGGDTQYKGGWKALLCTVKTRGSRVLRAPIYDFPLRVALSSCSDFFPLLVAVFFFVSRRSRATAIKSILEPPLNGPRHQFFISRSSSPLPPSLEQLKPIHVFGPFDDVINITTPIIPLTLFLFSLLCNETCGNAHAANLVTNFILCVPLSQKISARPRFSSRSYSRSEETQLDFSCHTRFYDYSPSITRYTRNFQSNAQLCDRVFYDN